MGPTELGRNACFVRHLFKLIFSVLSLMQHVFFLYFDKLGKYKLHILGNFDNRDLIIIKK